MKKNLEDLSDKELGKLFPIIISDSSDEWPVLFEEERCVLQKLLGNRLAIRIEHIGSTAVPNLAAKATIDILVEIPPDKKQVPEIIDKMTQHDYHYIPRTDSPPAYPMFVKGYTINGIIGQSFHIHMAPKDHSGLWDRLYFRDYLKEHPDEANKYEILKRKLAVEYTFDREKYTEAKSDFIMSMTNKAKMIANSRGKSKKSI